MKVYLAMCYYYAFSSCSVDTVNMIINVCATEELAKKVIRGCKSKDWISVEEIEPTSEIWIRQVESLDKENRKGWKFYIKEEEVLE